MSEQKEFHEALDRIRGLYPWFSIEHIASGEAWVELEFASRVQPVRLDTLATALRNISMAAAKADLAIVLDSNNFGDIDLSKYGFASWIDSKAIMRPRPNWSASIEKVPGFSFEEVAINEPGLLSSTGSENFLQLVDSLLSGNDWPDRDSAADRLRIAIFRTGADDIYAVEEDLGVAREAAFAL